MTNMSNFCSGGDITKIYVVEPISNGVVNNLTATTVSVSGDLNVNGNIINCGTGSTIVDIIEACDEVITLASDIVPPSDNLISIGRPTRRFRDINVISGNSTVWTSTQEIITPQLNLGLDSLNNLRIITADNSIIQDDILTGGSY